MDGGMEEIKDAINSADFELLDKLLTDKTPEFCSEAFYWAVEKEWNDASLVNTPKPMPFDIQMACETKRKEIAQIFLDHGANVNYVHEKKSIFSVACSNSSASIVKMMIDHGADLNAEDESGFLPIQLAFDSRDEDKMNLFLDRGISAEDINYLDLLKPAVRTSTEIVRRLVQLGADVNHTLEDIRPTIFQAVYFENLVMVKFLIDCGADLNITDHRGDPTLRTAVFNGNVEIVKVLLENGANANLGREDPLLGAIAIFNFKKDRLETCLEIIQLLLQYGVNVDGRKEEYSPISVAASQGHEDIVKLLLKAGASQDDSALIWAINREHEKIVTILLESGYNPDSESSDKDDFNITRRALCWAVHRQNKELIKLLLQHGANIDGYEDDCESPITAAATCENKEIVELLLSHGASIDGYEGDDESPISVVASQGHEDIVKLLLDKGAMQDDSALIWAINRGHERIVKILLESGYDSECESSCERGFDFQRRALIWAVYSQNKEVIKLLLQHGAYIGRYEDDWDSPIEVAATRGNKEIVELLLSHGASIDGYEGDDESPIVSAVAAVANRQEIVAFLLDKGAMQDDIALFYAIRYRAENIVKLLLERGYDPNCKSPDRYYGVFAETALFRAVVCRNKEIVKLLLDYGAQVDGLIEKDGGTALNLSAEERYVAQDIDIVQILLDYGADINKVYKGETALAISIRKRRFEICERLMRHMLLMKAQDLYVSEKNLSASKGFEKLEEYQKSCEDEMDMLKTSKFDDSNLSYLDIFTIKDVQKLTSLANNRDILKVLKSNDFKNEFPIYGEMIVDHFDKGFVRKQDFDLLKRFINYLSARNHDKLPELPSTFVHKLFTRLSENDFVSIKKL